MSPSHKEPFSTLQPYVGWGIRHQDGNDKLIDDQGRIESHLLFYGQVATSLLISANLVVSEKSANGIGSQSDKERGLRAGAPLGPGCLGKGIRARPGPRGGLASLDQVLTQAWVWKAWPWGPLPLASLPFAKLYAHRECGVGENTLATGYLQVLNQAGSR